MLFIFVKSGKLIFDKTNTKMTAISNLFKANKSQDAFAENQDLIAIRIGSAKRLQAATMSYNEVANQREQEYYNRASGCSVKAQKDNLFDYALWEKN
jgi:hypothetical protein